MKILLVTDQYYSANNGMTISARRFKKILEMHGHTVRVLTCAKPEQVRKKEEAYLLKKKYIPIFDKLITAQGMQFGKIDSKVIKEAVAWAELVHILSPFAMSHHAILWAKRLSVPFTGAFHVQPENITSSLHMGHVMPLNALIYRWFYFYIYRYCSHIHCPSRFIAGELEKHGYKNKLHVISNGIDPDFKYRKLPKDRQFENKFVVLMVGRLSIEKRQDVLIKAVRLSKYADKIQLVLAGRGPRSRIIRHMGKKLPNPVKIGFFKKQELQDLIAMSDLYVHAADMEIEAMSCMEAFAGGLVPIIADSKKSATPQFALDERSLFKAGDGRELAEKIDYWIEHEDERKAMERLYSEAAAKYALESCVTEAEAMFAEAAAWRKPAGNVKKNIGGRADG